MGENEKGKKVCRRSIEDGELSTVAQGNDPKDNFEQNSDGAISSLLFMVSNCSSPFYLTP